MNQEEQIIAILDIDDSSEARRLHEIFRINPESARSLDAIVKVAFMEWEDSKMKQPFGAFICEGLKACSDVQEAAYSIFQAGFEYGRSLRGTY